MAAVALSYLIEKGVRSFCTSSTGNSSTAYARLMPLAPDCCLYLFTAESFMDRVKYTDNDQVIHLVLRDATFVDAFEAAKQYADSYGVVSERGFFNPGRREGLKLAYLEAAGDSASDRLVRRCRAPGVWDSQGRAGVCVDGPSLPRLLRAAGDASHGPGARPAGDPARNVERPTGIASPSSAATRSAPTLRFQDRDGGDAGGRERDRIREARS
jgi:hypothetical protein